MSFGKIITFLLIGLVVLLIATSYLSFDNQKVDDLKDGANDKIDTTFENIKDSNTVSKPLETYDTLKSRVLYGSFDRNIPMEAYFCPEDDCLKEILYLIEDSKKTIDCAVYDLSLQSITDALILKADSGVEVRFVSDYGRSGTKASNIGLLKDSNVSVITNPTESSYMHNKFCVFDGKKILVGSMNFTLNGNYKNNNNVLVLEDKELAKAYTEKIDSFFEGDFSPKVKESPTVNAYGNVENYFCPEDDCLFNLLRVVEDVNSSLDCMLFSFTLNDFFNTVVDKDIEQRYILEKLGVSEYSQYNNLKNNSIPVIIDQNPNNMHNKFCIIDNSYVLTGSMNISNNGTKNNDETFLIVYDEKITQEYMDYFNNYWSLWSGS